MIADHSIERDRKLAAVIGPDVSEIPGTTRVPSAQDFSARVTGADQERQDSTVRGVLGLLDVGEDPINPGLKRTSLRIGRRGWRQRGICSERLIVPIPGERRLLIMEILAGERHLPDLVGAGGP